MDASVVVGKPNFTDVTPVSPPTASSKANAISTLVIGGKLLTSDIGNHRVLIFNSIPTTNGSSADVVIGQTNFVTNTANQGGSPAANTLNTPSFLATDGQKLFVADALNNRVLIYNSIPTSNNTFADVVIGQSNFSGVGTGTSNSAFNTPRGVAVFNGKLIVTDENNSRVMIWNSIPTSNGVSADVILSTTSGIAVSAPFQVSVNDAGKLAVADRGRNRVLLWDSIPTVNNSFPNAVVGQPDFSTTTPGVTATIMNGPRGVFIDNNRLYVSDRNNNRVLIYNAIPSTNGASADIVLGQPDFISSSAANGISRPVSAKGLSGPFGVFAYNNQLFVEEFSTNSRILIFNNIINNPGLSLNNSPEDRGNGILRLSGNASIPSTSSYNISSVQYSVNGGSLSGATPTDGSFNSTSEDFYFDFDPKANQPRDNSGNLIDGYTVKVKSTNTNTDVTDNLFYFSPFDLNGPTDNTTVSTAFPTFSFAVNRQRTNMRDNLSRYQVQVRPGSSTSNAPWQTVVDDIPVDFSTVQTSDSNLQKNTYLNRNPNNGDGVYETSQFKVTYSVDSSRLQVTSKIIPLSGTYQWKIVAVDKSGHSQEAGARNLYVNATSIAVTNNFPLAVLNISGLGNPHINSYNPGGVKSTYYTSSSNPIFFGIAWTNSKVTLKLTDQSCKTDCVKTYTTTANALSRFGINVPKGSLSYGKKYTANLSVAHEDKYNELPQFTLSISRPTSNTLEATTSDSIAPTTTPVMLPSPNPTPEPQPIPSPTPEKRCFLFFCR